MSSSRRIHRKLFLSWGLTSASAWAFGCSAEDPSVPGGGGSAAGGVGGTGGGTGGSVAGATTMAGTFSSAGTPVTAGAAGNAGAGGMSGAGSAGAAGSGGSGGSVTIAPDCSGQLKVKITSDHGHSLVVTLADVTAGVAKVYDTKGTANHPHWIQLTPADFSKLQTGATVRKLSCNDGHEHEFIINCVGVAMPDTTSGISQSCDTDHKCGEAMASICPELP